MRIAQVRSTHATILFVKDGTEILFSYSTPVAAYIPGRGFVKTDKFWSKTTSRHINKYLSGVDTVAIESQTFFDLLEEDA